MYNHPGFASKPNYTPQVRATLSGSLPLISLATFINQVRIK